ncbi:hypothetical protein B5X24_HaOG208974 [Helicoverpa armigera]|uniref:Uncharacterized protein n=1 Tax=Helicoverpa armigera TaxID=29058 RepID=A0A2W1BPU1_HELAM|nr:hypothetical protein B5X24_HaOG208974 [Helicoverpa armigera]
MDFDLKVACSLIPVMDGVEATTKRLIDSVEMYAGMLDAPDGLRSSRLSTIISARGFNNLKDAIQAAKDEECTSFQASEILAVVNIVTITLADTNIVTIITEEVSVEILEPTIARPSVINEVIGVPGM